MNPIFQVYHFLFYQPIFNFLIFLYNFFHDFGLAIVFLTLFIRIILFPLSLHSSRAQQKIAVIQKELKEIERKYNGKERMEKTFEFYKKNKINPFSIFISFIQLPILIALYQVFLKGVKESSINPNFLGFFDLSKPNLLFALFVAFFQYFYSKNQVFKKESNTEFFSLFQKQFDFFLALFTFLILSKLPSAISIYLIVNFLFLIFQKKYFHA